MMPDEEESYSVRDAAKVLFVSRSFVLKLLERGKLELHHRTADNVLITRASVLRYLADQDAARQAYQALSGKSE